MLLHLVLMLRQSLELHSTCRRVFFNLSVESNRWLLWFCLTSPCDWSRKFAPPSKPIRFKTRTNRDLVTRVFPPFMQYAHNDHNNHTTTMWCNHMTLILKIQIDTTYTLVKLTTKQFRFLSNVSIILGWAILATENNCQSSSHSWQKTFQGAKT